MPITESCQVSSAAGNATTLVRGGFALPSIVFYPHDFLKTLDSESGILVACAIAKRNVPQAHKRLMLIASIGPLTAAVARLPFDFIADAGPPAFFGLTDMFLLALVAWDVATRRRLHPATLWAGLLLVASQPLRLLISGTGGWLAFAGWAVALVR